MIDLIIYCIIPTNGIVSNSLNNIECLSKFMITLLLFKIDMEVPTSLMMLV